MSRRKIKAIVHAIAGLAAFATMLTFMVVSVWSELTGNPAIIAAAKEAIRWGLLLLVPAMAATGASAVALVGMHPKGVAGVKLGRMRIIAFNGFVILVPSVLYLAWKASNGAFDGWFLAVQAVEYAAGATNLVLMGLNIRDGFRLSGRFRTKQAAYPSRW